MKEQKNTNQIQPMTNVLAEIYIGDRKLKGFMGSDRDPGQVCIVVPGVHPFVVSNCLQLRGQLRDQISFPVRFKGDLIWARECEYAGQAHTIFCVNLDSSSSLPYPFMVRNLQAS